MMTKATKTASFSQLPIIGYNAEVAEVFARGAAGGTTMSTHSGGTRVHIDFTTVYGATLRMDS
jgi:hypothetical protein